MSNFKMDKLKERLLYQWERLTEEDLTGVVDPIVDIAKRLRKRYGYTPAQAEKAVRNFFTYRYYNVHAE